MSFSILFFNIFETKHGTKNLAKDITIAYGFLSISQKISIYPFNTQLWQPVKVFQHASVLAGFKAHKFR